MTRVHAADGIAARRICARAAALSAVVGHSAAGQGGLHLGRGQEFLHPQRRRSRRHRTRRPGVSAGRRSTCRAPRRSPSRSPRTSCSTTTARSSARFARSCSPCASKRAYSKDKILELYLNEIYLGLGNYGVAAAALGLLRQVGARTDSIARSPISPPCPRNRTTTIRSATTTAPIDRRNYVIDRMVEDGYITARAGEGGARRAADRHARAC